MSSLAHTLGRFYENLSTGPLSINQTSTEMHCAVSALSDQALLPFGKFIREYQGAPQFGKFQQPP